MRLKSADTFGDFPLARPGVSGLLDCFDIVFRPDLSGSGSSSTSNMYHLTVVFLPLMSLVSLPPNRFQNFPDFVNQPSFPDGILRPGQVTHKSLLHVAKIVVLDLS